MYGAGIDTSVIRKGPRGNFALSTPLLMLLEKLKQDLCKLPSKRTSIQSKRTSIQSKRTSIQSKRTSIQSKLKNVLIINRAK